MKASNEVKVSGILVIVGGEAVYPLICLTVMMLSGCTHSDQHKIIPTKKVAAYFITDRQDSGISTLDRFQNRRAEDDRLAFGTIRAEIPQPHKPGSCPALLNATFGPVTKTAKLPEAASLFTNATNQQTILVFVHGYRDSFATAMRRAVGYCTDMQSGPLPVAFSWPSLGKYRGYFGDEQQIEISADYLADFLLSLSQQSRARVVLVGRSLGCRLMLHAIKLVSIKTRGPHSGAKPIAALVLIEPDVDPALLRHNHDHVTAVCGHTTIYTSRHDIALNVSTWLHSNHSVKVWQKLPEFADIDLIDVTALKANFVGHSYDGPELERELELVIRGVPADHRPCLSSNGYHFILSRSGNVR